MVTFKNRPGRGSVIFSLMIELVVGFGWFCNIALAQVEFIETLTGSVNFSGILITCIGNLAVFITSLLRGRFDLEMGARDVLATLRGPKLDNIKEFGFTTCKEYQNASVVMLSTDLPNSSIKQFMKYISSAHGVESILLQCCTLETTKFTTATCKCERSEKPCGNCIVFSAEEEIIIMLALRMPGTIKRLPDSQFLLPSLHCLRSGCHECDQRLLHVETDQSGKQSLTEGEPEVEAPAAVCETLNLSFLATYIKKKRICICIPVYPACRDDWTKMLIRSFGSKAKEAAGVRVMGSTDLENYVAERRAYSHAIYNHKIASYSTASLIVPRFIEISLNLVLTGWFRVDGFSSSLIARRTVRNYVLDSGGSGFVINTFLAEALVKSNRNNTHICQVLTFRGTLLSLRNLSLIIGCVNLICSVSWAVLVTFEGGAGKWYNRHSVPPSKPTVVVIMSTIGICLGMDCFQLYLGRFRLLGELLSLWALILLETACIVSGILVGGALGIKSFGKWLYSVLQALVWVKWGIGSYLLGEFRPEFRENHPTRSTASGILVYSSAFLLNSILAGVRAKWDYKQSQDN